MKLIRLLILVTLLVSCSDYDYTPNICIKSYDIVHKQCINTEVINSSPFTLFVGSSGINSKSEFLYLLFVEDNDGINLLKVPVDECNIHLTDSTESVHIYGNQLLCNYIKKYEYSSVKDYSRLLDTKRGNYKVELYLNDLNYEFKRED